MTKFRKPSFKLGGKGGKYLFRLLFLLAFIVLGYYVLTKFISNDEGYQNNMVTVTLQFTGSLNNPKPITGKYDPNTTIFTILQKSNISPNIYKVFANIKGDAVDISSPISYYSTNNVTLYLMKRLGGG